jgi:hypothetical protein
MSANFGERERFFPIDGRLLGFLKMEGRLRILPALSYPIEYKLLRLKMQGFPQRSVAGTRRAVPRWSESGTSLGGPGTFEGPIRRIHGTQHYDNEHHIRSRVGGSPGLRTRYEPSHANPGRGSHGDSKNQHPGAVDWGKRYGQGNVCSPRSSALVEERRPVDKNCVRFDKCRRIFGGTGAKPERAW